jgi:hypothetical protein
MVHEAGCIKLQNSQILKLCNMLLEIEKIKKDLSGRYGYQESMLVLEI